MKKGFWPLASGSKGNSIYLNTGTTKILIDAGLSGKATAARLAEINVDISDLDAIVISHDHIDHIQGLRVLAFKHGLPVFANADTAKGICRQFRDCPKFHIFTTGDPFEFQDLKIHPFSIQHDTEDPVAFTIEMQSTKMGFCTDLGFATQLVEHHLQDCDYLYVESNHEPSMVHACSRPFVYKQRVLGRTGHLSNEACGQLLGQVASSRLKHVHLAHLSEECNHPDIALRYAQESLVAKRHEVPIHIAHQHVVSHPVFF